MTPTLVMRDGKVVLVTGAPGGSRIISAVLQVITNVIDRRQTIAEAVAAPRLHHQWLPDEVLAENAVAPDLVAGLEARGHAVVRGGRWSSANSILVTPDGLAGAADPRTRARWRRDIRSAFAEFGALRCRLLHLSPHAGEVGALARRVRGLLAGTESRQEPLTPTLSPHARGGSAHQQAASTSARPCASAAAGSPPARGPF